MLPKYFVILILSCCFSFSQNKNKITEKYIEDNVNKIHNNKSINYVTKKQLLAAFEKQIIKTKDTTLILKLYQRLIVNNLLNFDQYNAKKIDKKIVRILQKYKDKRQLGLYYLYHTYIYHFEYENNVKLNGYLKSVRILEKYGNSEELIFPYYLISSVYRDMQQYDKAIFYALKNKKIITKNNYREEDLFYFYLFLYNNYTLTNQKDSVAFYRKKIIDSKLDKVKFKSYLVRYYNTESIYLIEQKKYKEAIQKILSSDSIYRNFYTDENKKLMEINSKNIQLKENEIVHNQVVAKLNELEYQKKIGFLILTLAIFIIVIFIVYTYFKAKLLKTFKVNNAALELVNKKLEASNASKNIFINTLSHEIKTPINTIKSLNYLINENSDLITKAEFQKSLNFSSNHLINLIDNFIYHNNLNSNTFEITNKFVNPNKIISNIINTFKLDYKNKNEYFFISDDTINFNILIDELKLTQVLINLLNNASKFTVNGQIYVILKCVSQNNNQAELYFEVKDNGIGIEKSKIETIFNPFEQESKEINYTYGGMGLGLSIVKKIIELFGSTIQIESEKGKGTKLFFTLNVAIETHQKIINKKNTTLRKILLVEDNKINQVLTKKIISNKGYLCDVANNGLEAVNMYKTNEYDLVFMDIMMPVMDGYEATKLIKETYPNAVIIALTSLAKENNANENLFYKFISKPISPQTIYEIIEETNSK